MLTREVEGNLIKCGNYWKDGKYGPYVLKIETQVGEEGETIDRIWKEESAQKIEESGSKKVEEVGTETTRTERGVRERDGRWDGTQGAAECIMQPH